MPGGPAGAIADEVSAVCQAHPAQPMPAACGIPYVFSSRPHDGNIWGDTRTGWEPRRIAPRRRAGITLVCDGRVTTEPVRRTIGLTGGIGAGKSAVAARLAELGAIVIDSDKLAREVVEPGTPGLARVVEEFGPEVLDEHGALDRPALAKRVFGDDEARRRLESIVHPLVRERHMAIVAAAPPDAVLVNDVPLLIEAGMAGLYERVIVVLAGEATRLDRLVRVRGMSEGDARARMSKQATDEQRRAVADFVIVNDGTPDELRAAVDEVWSAICGTGGSEA
jgi:dephospho-CoA kinase